MTTYVVLYSSLGSASVMYTVKSVVAAMCSNYLTISKKINQSSRVFTVVVNNVTKGRILDVVNQVGAPIILYTGTYIIKLTAEVTSANTYRRTMFGIQYLYVHLTLFVQHMVELSSARFENVGGRFEEN